LLAKGIDILLLNLVDPGAGDTILKLAKAKNVPVVFFNRAPNMEILSNWEKCWYVGISWRAPGLVQSTLVLADWKANKAKMDKNGDGILQYALIQGNVSQQDAIHRTAAIKDTFAEYNKSGEMKNELLDLQVADWNTTKAKELMDVWNVKYGNKIEAVVSNNDAMALGAIESMKAAGVFTTPGKYVYVYGINCLPEVAQLLKSGELSGTVLTSPWMQAVACVDIAVNVFNGKEPLAGTTFKFDTNKDVRVVDIAITKANMADGVSAYEKCK
jgi:methyl-galactoside transport system substrate-binding protein